MLISGKEIAFCLLFFLGGINSGAVYAGNIENLNWLPLLTVSMQKLQPDISCPQNQVIGLQVTKDKLKTSSNIQEVNWDLDCIQAKQKRAESDNKDKSNDPQKQVTDLLKKLSHLPDFKVHFKAVNLTSKLIRTAFSSNLSIKKASSTIHITFKSDLLTGKASLNLQDNNLLLNTNVSLEKLSKYIELTDQQKQYFNDNLVLHYQSDLDEWYKGVFKAGWQGGIPDLSENIALSIEGEVDLLKEKITLTTLLVKATNILTPISDKQSWKAGYIKLKNTRHIHFNYGEMSIISLPIDIRVGGSSLLTKVERGKSKRIRIDKQKLPPVLVQLDIRGKEAALQVDWDVTSLNQKVSGIVSVDPELVKLQVMDNVLDSKSLVESVRSYANGLALLEVDKASIQLDILVKYLRQEKTFEFKSKLVSDDISGRNDNITFSGANFDSQLHYIVDAQNSVSILKDEQQLNMADLFVGIPIQSLQVDGRIDAGQPLIQHFKARLLGGRLDFDDFKLNAPSQTVLNIAGISLAEVIKYSAYPEIKSKGLIDGMLPLELTTKGPEIKDGIIFARSPGGYIKVPENTVIKAMGRGNPALSFTLQILSNFQFDTLLGRIGYTSNGESDLKIEIKGISPTVSGAQPINFNYSHNENILKLLKALRFNDELVRDIKERY